MLAHQFVPAVGVLTWAVALGMVAGNTRLLPRRGAAGAGPVTKRLLRIGIVLLGFSVSFGAIAALGLGTIGLVASPWWSRWWSPPGWATGRGSARPAACSSAPASRSAAPRRSRRWRTPPAPTRRTSPSGSRWSPCSAPLAMVLLPLLARPARARATQQFGIWAGASIQEVGQVVAAAGAGGAAVVAVAVVVKLTRVLLLAPVVATVSVRKRMTAGGRGRRKRPPHRAAVRARLPRLRRLPQHRAWSRRVRSP